MKIDELIKDTMCRMCNVDLDNKLDCFLNPIPCETIQKFKQSLIKLVEESMPEDMKCNNIGYEPCGCNDYNQALWECHNEIIKAIKGESNEPKEKL